ncbi:Non-specific protein-tyrosine kinase [Aphelenchoides bicaudatus]|nr:Non-specific protein-tyrosine kinase [Aphelenchoides bicaudatus]
MRNREFIISYDTGHFGDGDLIRTKKKQLLYIRTLNNSLSVLPSIEEDLEKLVRLKHKYIARMKEFKVKELNADKPLLVMTINEGFDQRLSSHLKSLDGVQPTRQYVNWAYQAGKGVSYLLVCGIYHKMLSAQTCLLDSHGNIKLCDFWTSTDFISNSEIWRSLPPETLLENVFTLESLIWTFAHLIWQIFTHCKLVYRSKFKELSEFVSIGYKDDEFYLPGSVNINKLKYQNQSLYYPMIDFNKLCAQFPHAPKSFNRFVRKCLSSEAHARPTWAKTLTMLSKEHRIFKLMIVVDIFNFSKS